MLTRLAALLDAIRYETLPAQTIRKTKVAVQNYIGGSLPGVKAPLTEAEYDFWRRQGCAQGSCVAMGRMGKTSVIAAAATNAAMGEIYLSEDMHNPTSSHPGMLVIPVAVAFGEETNADGKRVIEAIVAGYEAMGRIGAALLAPGFTRNGLRPASTLAPFGGAVAAAKVLGLGVDGIARALSIAGNTSAGVMEFVNAGTADICMQNAFAAKSSVMAAELAARGIQASPTILDGRFGLGLGLNNVQCDWEQMFADRPGTGYVMDECVVKGYPGCGYVQCSAQAAMKLVRENDVRPEDVKSVTVGVCHASKVWPGVDNPGPFKGTISAMMSHQFMTACAILRHRIDVDCVNDYADAGIAELTARISVVEDEEIQRAGGAGARITVHLKDGGTVQSYVESVVYMSDEDVLSRMQNYAKPYFSAGRIDEICAATEKLEALSSIRQLSWLLEKE